MKEGTKVLARLVGFPNFSFKKKKLVSLFFGIPCSPVIKKKLIGRISRLYGKTFVVGRHDMSSRGFHLHYITIDKINNSNEKENEILVSNFFFCCFVRGKKTRIWEMEKFAYLFIKKRRRKSVVEIEGKVVKNWTYHLSPVKKWIFFKEHYSWISIYWDKYSMRKVKVERRSCKYKNKNSIRFNAKFKAYLYLTMLNFHKGF